MNQNNLSYAINIEDNLCTAGLGIGLVGFGSGRFRVNKIGFWIFPSWNGFNKNFRYFLIFLYIPLDLDFDIFYTISGNLTKDNLTKSTIWRKKWTISTIWRNIWNCIKIFCWVVFFATNICRILLFVKFI